MSLQRCQQETTAAEFIEWIAYLEKSVNDFNPLWHYLAQIAMEVFYCFRKRPANPKTDPWLIRFEFKQVGKKDAPETPEQTARFKGFFGSLKAVGRANRRLRERGKKVKPNGRRPRT